MRRFELLEPTSLREACEMLAADEEAKLIAGGTALLVLIKQGIFRPETLINLKKVQGASEISYDPERGLRLGAMASIHHVERAPVVRAIAIGRPQDAHFWNLMPSAAACAACNQIAPSKDRGSNLKRNARSRPVGVRRGATMRSRTLLM